MKLTQPLLIPVLAVLTVGACVAAFTGQARTGTGPAAKAAVTTTTRHTTHRPSSKTTPIQKVVKTEAEWKTLLTPAQFDVMRKAGTEAPFTSALLNIHDAGTFRCVACDLDLFLSKTKFESGTGWPSFWAPLAENRVVAKTDTSLGETRNEVLCARCGAHLGHVFDDGPAPTHLRYCMNGVALKFVPTK